MGVFSRLLKVGQARANEIVDKLEKPEQMLEQAIRDREKQIGVARQNVQKVIATERQSKATLDKELLEQQNWEERARTALSAGNEELAAKALERSEEHASKASALKPTWEAQRQEVEVLKKEVQQMQNELSSLKRDKDIIIAQSKAAEVKKSIYEAKAKIGKNNTTDLIARMRAKAERQGFEAQAAQELSSVGQDSLESDFAKLSSKPPSNIQDKLAKMKQDMGR